MVGLVPWKGEKNRASFFLHAHTEERAHEEAVRRRLFASQEESPHQTPNLHLISEPSASRTVGNKCLI
jgi:hypothetical protein